MNRENLEHLIRAAGIISECKTIIVIGSQSILGKYPNAPDLVRQSMEADLIPVEHPERWNLIDGVLGELSPFHETFGYYADGVETNTATLPNDWQERLIEIENPNTNGIKGLCLEPHDMVISKLIAGREKDKVVAKALATAKLIDSEILYERLDATEVNKEIKEIIRAHIDRIFN